MCFVSKNPKCKKSKQKFDFSGYYEYWNSAEKKGYSGVAIFSKQEPLSVGYDMGIAHHDKEGALSQQNLAIFIL